MTEARRPLVFVFPRISGDGGYKVMAGDRFGGIEIAVRFEEADANGIADRINAAFSTRAQEIKADTEAWLSTRLIDWLKSTPRKPANIAFTEGPLRLMAYAVEEAVRGSRAEALEEAARIVENEPDSINMFSRMAASIRKAKEGT